MGPGQFRRGWAAALHLFDLATFTALMVATQGAASPFFVSLIFLLVQRHHTMASEGNMVDGCRHHGSICLGQHLFLDVRGRSARRPPHLLNPRRLPDHRRRAARVSRRTPSEIPQRDWPPCGMAAHHVARALRRCVGNHGKGERPAERASHRAGVERRGRDIGERCLDG